MTAIYLDNTATTKPKKEVIEAIMPYLMDEWHNPSSLYSPSKNVKNDIELARKTIANFIGVKQDEIYFTSGGSESNCWAVQGWIDNYVDRQKTIITTNIEHKSLYECVKNNMNPCLEVQYVGVNLYGIVNMYELEDMLNYADRRNRKIMVSIQYANSEIGTIQDIKNIAKLVHKYNGVLHVDAVQAFGKISINVEELGIDMMSASAHKIGGIKGSGFLYKRNGINIKPLIYGSQEQGLRGGTENVIGIIGLAKAVELCKLDREVIEEMCEIRDYVINILVNDFECKLNGHNKFRLPNNINVTFPNNITGESLLYILDLSDIFISTGSACDSNSIVPSRTLKEIGLSDEEAMKTIRITLPDFFDYLSIDDYRCMIDKFIYELGKAIKIIETQD